MPTDIDIFCRYAIISNIVSLNFRRWTMGD